MNKFKKIMYWILTLWLALGMFSTGMVQILKNQTEVDFIANLGYPSYLLSILGVWKILGVVAILIPKTPVLKEWAYAGFFFVMTGAVFSHVAANSYDKMLPALLLLVLTLLSYFLRPETRKINSLKTETA